MTEEKSRNVNDLIRENNTPFTTKIEWAAGLPIYIGKARAGTLTSVAHWQIMKLTWDGSDCTDVKWADSVTTFTKEWDERASYTFA